MSSPIATSRSFARTSGTRARSSITPARTSLKRARANRVARPLTLTALLLLLGVSHNAHIQITSIKPLPTTQPALPTQPVLPTAPALPTADAASTSSLGQPRLRRLHLVRPDLIRYPLAVEAIC